MFKTPAIGTLLSHYWEVFEVAWKNRHFDHRQLAEYYESEFLPDAIELQETNASPILGWTGYLLITMIGIVIVWASLSKVDIVAIATGRLISSDYTKTIQSLSTSKIKTILVKNGQAVAAGQVLLQLDDTEVATNIQKLSAIIPLLRKKVIAYKSLLADGYVSEHNYFDKQKELLETIAQFEQARYLKETMAIVSPIDGFVSGLAVHTIGGVVTPGQKLLSIVPANGELVLEAYLNNKDVGFVRVGQEVVIKLDAFPFTRYGHIKGVVSMIANDSIEKPDEKPAKVKESDIDGKTQTVNNYQIRVALEQTTISIAGESTMLFPGMVATAEIKTGKRTLMSYLLSPLVENIGEAARER